MGVTRIELAVILVTDLVGSTALGARLGSARFDDFRREHDSLLRDAAEDVGGRVVKNTGDGLLVAFPSVSGALEGAVRMQQKLERRNRSAEVAMGVRIGISIGDASVEDGDYFGLPPIEATRLCAKARGGEIFIADPVRAVIRDRGTHELEPVGPLNLKGLAEPVVGWRVLWEPLPEGGGPALPPRLRSVPETAYVGRSAERRTLLECWDRVVDSDRQVAIISGEPGIGKTRLVTQTARTAVPDHALILYGRCDEDQGVPYYAWREVLRDYVQTAPRRLLRPHASELSRLVPGLSAKLGDVSAPPTSDPDTERYLLFNAVQSLFAAATELAPVLVILDDLHWADRSTLLLLKHLVIASTSGRLMLLGTFRDSDIAQEDLLTAVLADLYREPGVTRLSLVGLDLNDIVDLIEELAGHPIDAAGLALAREVHRETAGNPFFVGEMLRHLRETGVIARQPDGRWSFRSSLAGHGLPQSVREVIERRVLRLSEAARRLLTVGAVIGDEFDLQLAARSADLSAARALDLLDEAIAASLLSKTAITRESQAGLDLTEVYAFSHGLVAATLYEALPAGRRAALHLAVGEAIESTSGEEIEDRLDDLAHHFLAAVPAGGAERAVGYATRAGERAMRAFAYDQAAGLFARALAVPGGAEDGRARIALLQSLGAAQMRAGDSEEARRTLLEAADAARRHDEPEALARATRAYAIWGLSFGVDAVLVALAEETIERLGERGSPLLIAEIKGLLAVALYYAPTSYAGRRERLATEALAGARAAHAERGTRESLETLAYVVGRHLLAWWGPASAMRDFALADELLELAGEVGDVELELLARNWRTTAFGQLGDFDALDEEVARIEHMATELRQPRAMVFLPLHRGLRAVCAGRFGEAERLNAESDEMRRRVAGSVSGLAAYSQMMLIRMQQGRLPELEGPVREMLVAYPDMVAIRAGLIGLLLQAGKTAEARAEFERVVGDGLAALPRNNVHILTLALLADAAWELGDARRAAALYDRLAPYAGQWVVAVSSAVLWPVDRSLGVLATATGAIDGAFAHLEAARRQGEEADALPGLALIALDEARLLVLRAAPGDGEAASRRAADAGVLAESLDMRRVGRQAAELAAELSAARAPATPDPGAVGAP
ncbi:MAG: ATP-binding protein [Solirubrobacteraceae bacterium]